MIKRLIGYFSSPKKEEPDALTRLFMDPNSKESRRILEDAVREANEEQRKIYYGDTQKSEA